MSGEPWYPVPPDEPYPARGEPCPDCGRDWLPEQGEPCACGLTVEEVAERLAEARRNVQPTTRGAPWI